MAAVKNSISQRKNHHCVQFNNYNELTFIWSGNKINIDNTHSVFLHSNEQKIYCGAAYEPRIAALIADAGTYDVGLTLLHNLQKRNSISQHPQIPLQPLDQHLILLTPLRLIRRPLHLHRRLFVQGHRTLRTRDCIKGVHRPAAGAHHRLEGGRALAVHVDETGVLGPDDDRVRFSG
jgi:hypothetical protein